MVAGTGRLDHEAGHHSPRLVTERAECANRRRSWPLVPAGVISPPAATDFPSVPDYWARFVVETYENHAAPVRAGLIDAFRLGVNC